MSHEYDEFADEASKRLVEDIRPIVGGYRLKLEKLVAERDAALAESERIKREALEAFDAAMDEDRKKCAASIRAAARERAKESERPEWILEACESYVKPIETGVGILDTSAITKLTGMYEKARRDSEKAIETRKRRANILQGIM